MSEAEKSSWSTEAIWSSCNTEASSKHKKSDTCLGDCVLVQPPKYKVAVATDRYSHSFLSYSTTVGVEADKISVMETWLPGTCCTALGQRGGSNGISMMVSRKSRPRLRLEHSVWNMDTADLWRPRHGYPARDTAMQSSVRVHVTAGEPRWEYRPWLVATALM